MKPELLSLQPEENDVVNHVVIESRSSGNSQAPRTVDARSYIARSVAIMGLVGVALVHLLDSGSKFHETPYVFWLYVLLMVSSLVLAGMLLHMESRLG